MSKMGFGPGNIDCDDVLEELYVYMDEETDAATKNQIRQHLEACAPCLRQYGLEQDVRALIARCCGGDRAPGARCTSGCACGSPNYDRDVPPEFRAEYGPYTAGSRPRRVTWSAECFPAYSPAVIRLWPCWPSTTPYRSPARGASGT